MIIDLISLRRAWTTLVYDLLFPAAVFVGFCRMKFLSGLPVDRRPEKDWLSTSICIEIPTCQIMSNQLRTRPGSWKWLRTWGVMSLEVHLFVLLDRQRTVTLLTHLVWFGCVTSFKDFKALQSITEQHAFCYQGDFVNYLDLKESTIEQRHTKAASGQRITGVYLYII